MKETHSFFLSSLRHHVIHESDNEGPWDCGGFRIIQRGVTNCAGNIREEEEFAVEDIVLLFIGRLQCENMRAHLPYMDYEWTRVLYSGKHEWVARIAAIIALREGYFLALDCTVRKVVTDVQIYSISVQLISDNCTSALQGCWQQGFQIWWDHL